MNKPSFRDDILCFSGWLKQIQVYDFVYEHGLYTMRFSVIRVIQYSDGLHD